MFGNGRARLRAATKRLPKVGPVRPLSPFIQISTSSLPISVGIAAEIEIVKNILTLSVDAQRGFSLDDDNGKVRGSEAMSGSLEFNLDIFFQSHPPSKP